MCLAIPGRVTELDPDGHFALVEVSGVRRRVNVDLLRAEGVARDDWVLIHVGFAMSRISAREAEEQMQLLSMLGEADAALEEVQGYGGLPERAGDGAGNETRDEPGNGTGDGSGGVSGGGPGGGPGNDPDEGAADGTVEGTEGGAAGGS